VIGVLRPSALPVALALAACAPVAQGSAAAASRQERAVSCSAHGLAAGSGAAGSTVRVVTLEATGLTCAVARGVARRLAQDVLRGATIRFPRASSLSVSQQTCSGCSSKTQVAVSFPRGSLRVSLTRAAAAGSLRPAAITA
jgi:hypothetical protein